MKNKKLRHFMGAALQLMWFVNKLHCANPTIICFVCVSSSFAVIWYYFSHNNGANRGRGQVWEVKRWERGRKQRWDRSERRRPYCLSPLVSAVASRMWRCFLSCTFAPLRGEGMTLPVRLTGELLPAVNTSESHMFILYEIHTFVAARLFQISVIHFYMFYVVEGVC